MTFKCLLQIVVSTYYLLSKFMTLEHSSTNACGGQNQGLSKHRGGLNKGV